jgi:hypothetical protein
MTFPPHNRAKKNILSSSFIAAEVKLFNNSSFNENTPKRAGRSAWYDRHVGIVEAAGPNPAPSTTLASQVEPILC